MEAIGRSRDSLTSKVHHASRFVARDRVDSLGVVRRLLTSPGQQGDRTCAGAPTTCLRPLCVVGDKAHDADKLRAHWQALGVGGRIRPKRDRTVLHPCDKALCRTWRIVENSFRRLKYRRRLSLRWDKIETSFRAFACFAAALMNLRLKVKLCP